MLDSVDLIAIEQGWFVRVVDSEQHPVVHLVSDKADLAGELAHIHHLKKY